MLLFDKREMYLISLMNIRNFCYLLSVEISPIGVHQHSNKKQRTLMPLIEKIIADHFYTL